MCINVLIYIDKYCHVKWKCIVHMESSDEHLVGDGRWSMVGQLPEGVDAVSLTWMGG